MSEETKPCKCGKKMILRRTGVCLTSIPPQYPQMWWCACGHRETGPTFREKSDEEIAMERWEKANEVKP